MVIQLEKSMNKIILRAITAYTRTDLKDSADNLAIKGREVVHGGKKYVVLENEKNEVHFATYRCMNRGELKRLKRWPAEILAKPEIKQLKTEKPAILELAPIKPAQKAVKVSKVKVDKNKQQTDLFE
jgi:hypothetical protein